jgi:MFS family permease
VACSSPAAPRHCRPAPAHTRRGGLRRGALAATLAPSLAVELALLTVTGFASTTFLATGNSTLQLTSEPRFRGRVMALWSVAFLGSTPVGGPIVGAIAQHLGPRHGLLLGAAACWLGAGIGTIALTHLTPNERRILLPAEAAFTSHKL